ncbi:corticosteroid 11-beta-dehydrogenase isozyme 1, partial [Elysia marginata]
AAAAKMGGLDILVLNHILPHPIQPFSGQKDDLDLLADLLKVNFRSYVHLASEALPHLQKAKGRIVVINSAVGKVSHPLLASYAATKHALDGFFSSLRSQFYYAGVEVGVTSCFLGYIGTASALRGIQTAGQSRLQTWVKPAKPEDTARAIAVATATQQDELYYPWLDVRPLVILNSVWPGLVDSVMRFISLRD